MTEKDLFREIGNINEKYVAEAQEVKRPVILTPAFVRYFLVSDHTISRLTYLGMLILLPFKESINSVYTGIVSLLLLLLVSVSNDI